MIKYVDRLQETEWFDHNVPEEYYTELVGRFAEMCLLLTNHLPDKSVWKNLKGITVTSKPDLRLFKCDTQDKVKETSFSVTQVKEDKYRDNKGENLAAKRMKISCSSDLDFDSKISKTTKRRPSKETANKVKGQHAGQLLLDLHSVHRKSFVNGSEYYMPGIIVHRTGVAVTMLVISKTHFEKIEKNEPLGLDDRAKIYVSCFYDYLNEEERNELIQVFLIMNNIQEYHTEHDEN
ncbi:uncharacterized protein LOC127709355 isoform X2 [Mytilus californianus]|nr:uncharacterized protein LOC127709355 isoform X2 [Mytilus californianus]